MIIKFTTITCVCVHACACTNGHYTQHIGRFLPNVATHPRSLTYLHNNDGSSLRITVAVEVLGTVAIPGSPVQEDPLLVLSTIPVQWDSRQFHSYLALAKL